jgi:hypothetical protein
MQPIIGDLVLTDEWLEYLLDLYFQGYHSHLNKEIKWAKINFLACFDEIRMDLCLVALKRKDLLKEAGLN